MTVKCLECGFVKATPTVQPSDTFELPHEGDFWLCSNCGRLHRFTGLMTFSRGTLVSFHVRKAEDAELEQLPEPDRSALISKRKEIQSQ